jgi:hypothetical protein
LSENNNKKSESMDSRLPCLKGQTVKQKHKQNWKTSYCKRNDILVIDLLWNIRKEERKQQIKHDKKAHNVKGTQIELK